MEFFQVDPSLENYWRSIILLGINVASYKFALAKSLYELNTQSNDLVTLEQLAEPFSKLDSYGDSFELNQRRNQLRRHVTDLESGSE